MRLVIGTCMILGMVFQLKGQQPVLQGYPFAKGAYTAVLEENGLLYCVTDYGMAIWDVGDPANPALRSKYVFPGMFSDGQVLKSGPYVVLLKERVARVVDVSDPDAPIDAPFSPWQIADAKCMALRDTFLYVGTGASLVTYSIADPAVPVAIDTLPDMGSFFLYRSDTALLAIRQNSVVRLSIGNGLPVPVDTVPAQDGLLLFDAMIAGGRLALLESDPMNGISLVKLYDVTVPGSPVFQESIDVSSFNDGRLLALDTSVLIIRGTPTKVYNISVPGFAALAGTLAEDTYIHALAPLGGDWAYAMNSVFGFSVLHRTGPSTFTVQAEQRVGDWVGELKNSTTTGYVLAEGLDSLYVLDPGAMGIGNGIRSSRLNSALNWWVFGDLLVELREADMGQYGLSILRIGTEGNLDSLTTLLPAHSGNSYQLGIWNNRLYWSGYLQTVTITDIYDVTDPAAPMFLDSIQTWFNLQRDGMLFTLWPEQGAVDLYDAVTVPPVLLATKSFTVGCTGFQVGFLYPDPERTILHQVGNGCYSVVDMQDTANVVSFGPYPISNSIGPMGDGIGVWNKVLYIPGVNTRSLHLFDVCEPGVFDSLTTVQFTNFPKDLAFVDPMVLVAFGGYVQQYDVSGVIPCLTLNAAAHAPAPTLRLHPNPAMESFYVGATELKGARMLELRDASGRLTLTMRINGGAEEVKVPCAGLPAGFYTVRSVGATTVATGKLVVE